MQIITTKKELSDFVSKSQHLGENIGFVPTMGALHPGHISLINQSKSSNKYTITSIFVNPTQFNDPKDLVKYPRPIEKDIQLLENAGCDILFLPEVNEMYEDKETWNHSFGEIEKLWEGAMRPGHFKGVGQIVYKLLKLVQPNNAYFGQKDLQQTLIVKKLIADFDLPTKLHVCPILREPDGLAMSSRNVRLSPEDRFNAGLIYKALMNCQKEYFLKHSLSEIKRHAQDFLKEIPNSQLEYFEIVDSENMHLFDPQLKNSLPVAIVAIKFQGARLIDNMFLSN